MLIKSEFEELFGDEQISILERSKSRVKMEGVLCAVYACLGMSVPCKEILSRIAQSTFTKSGTYTIFLIGSKEKRKVYLMVDEAEIRGGKDIYYELPNLVYKPRLFGLLGYKVVRGN